MKPKCSKCGACCREITFILCPDRKTFEFHKARGFNFHNRETVITFQDKCPHLTKDNLCDIHNKKPYLCKTIPEKLRKDLLQFQPAECAFRK